MLKIRLLIMVIISFLVGCATSQNIVLPLDKNNYAIVKTYYATDRNLTNETNPKDIFGTNRGELTYGSCDVSIPRDHRMGELESPFLSFDFLEDPKKHIVLLNTTIRSKDDFFKEVKARIHQSASSQAFIFVHGYKVSFEDAARRTAQISYDLGFKGVPVFYSWPSQGSLTQYPADEQNIEWTQKNLENFLDDFFARSEAENIYLIAHSMGNRALTRTIASLVSKKPDIKKRLKEVILAAPDIDADVFKNQIAPALTKDKFPITLYASSKDLALELSGSIHGNYPRAGYTGSDLLIINGIETIDASQVDASLTGHSYFAENRSIISDIYYIVNLGLRANDRSCLDRIDTKDGTYWVFKK